MQYATAEQLRDWMGAGEVSPRASVVLRSASWVVRRATAVDRYAVTSEGLPKDAPVALAFQEATCAQAAYWLANNVDPQAGLAGIPRPVSSKSSNGSSISYASDPQSAALADSLGHPVPEADAILRAAGLRTARIGGRRGIPPHIVTSPVFP